MEILNQIIISDYKIDGDSYSPKVILDRENNLFEFSGISLPDDAEVVYMPIIQWLEAYKKSPNPCTEVVFKMEFINHDSSKMISRVIEIFDEIHAKGNNVLIKWYYDIDDEDVRIEGRHYSNLYELPFELMNYRN